MKVCIPIEDKPQGGMYTFLRYLRDWCDRRGIERTNDIASEYDVLFVNSFMVPFEAVRASRDRLSGLRVVHRVDGSAADYGRDPADDWRQGRINALADATVFQSRYSRYATRRKFRVIGSRGVVIPNAVDTNRFRPDGERELLPGSCRVAHVAFSTNPRKGFDAVLAAAHSNPSVHFVLVGRYAGTEMPPNVTLVGLADHERLPRLLRSCHAMVFFAENESCPNVVLEGLASGLPILYRDSGATSELVGDAGVVATPDSLGEKVGVVMTDLPKWSVRARRRAEGLFAVDRVLPQYEEVLRRTKRSRVPVKVRLIWRWLCRYPVTYEQEERSMA